MPNITTNRVISIIIIIVFIRVFLSSYIFAQIHFLTLTLNYASNFVGVFTELIRAFKVHGTQVEEVWSLDDQTLVDLKYIYYISINCINIIIHYIDFLSDFTLFSNIG